MENDIESAAGDVDGQIKKVADDLAHLEPVAGAGDVAQAAGDDIKGVLENLHNRLEVLETHLEIKKAADTAEANADATVDATEATVADPPPATENISESIDPYPSYLR